MFIPLWVLIPVIALVLYRVKKLLDETGAQKTEIKELETALTEAVDWVTKYKKSLDEYQEYVKEVTRKRFNVRFAIRAVGDTPTAEQMDRLDKYAFDDEAQLEEFRANPK